jgi:hypothetical protein
MTSSSWPFVDELQTDSNRSTDDPRHCPFQAAPARPNGRTPKGTTMNNKTRFFAKVLLASGLIVAAACGGADATKVSGSGNEGPETTVQTTEAANGATVAPPNAGEGPLQHRLEEGEGAPAPDPVVPNADEGPLQHRLDR